jgi:hypothetical protein
LTRQARRTREHAPVRRIGGIISAVLVLGLLGCGGDDEQTTSAADLTNSSERPSAETAGSAAAQGDAARAAGRKACEGMTPLEAARHYEASARKAGATKGFVELSTEPSAKVESSSGYPRLAAAIYATTTPVKSRAQAAAGCAEVLAADGEGGEVSSERTGQTVPPSQGGADQKGSN